jgi:hypothetical protein
MRWISALLTMFAIGAVRADHFDDHQLAALQGTASRKDCPAAKRITLTDLAGMPKVIQGSPQSVLLVVHTDERNWCKLLVRGGGIKRRGSSVPKTFLHIERMTTYAADPKRGVLADKRDIYLFDGFAIDLDIGQIVAKGDGDDLSFEATAASNKKESAKEMMEEESRRLGPLQGTAIASAGVDIVTPLTPLVAASKTTTRTKTTGAITTSDFVGKYRLDVDGRFTGVLQLRLDEGKLTGSFTSDQSGSVYRATVSQGSPPQQIKLEISFPRTELKLEVRLFTKSRTKIAGTAMMEENAFGFAAERID